MRHPFPPARSRTTPLDAAKARLVGAVLSGKHGYKAALRQTRRAAAAAQEKVAERRSDCNEPRAGVDRRAARAATFDAAATSPRLHEAFEMRLRSAGRIAATPRSATLNFRRRPNAQSGRRPTIIERQSSLEGVGPTVFAGRIAATPRGATWTFRGRPNARETKIDESSPDGAGNRQDATRARDAERGRQARCSSGRGRSRRRNRRRRRTPAWSRASATASWRSAATPARLYYGSRCRGRPRSGPRSRSALGARK